MADDDSSATFLAGLIGSPIGGGVAVYLFGNKSAGVFTVLLGWAITLCYEGFVKDKSNGVAQVLGVVAGFAAIMAFVWVATAPA